MEHTTVNRRYRVDKRIGMGGMAEVYLGHDVLLNRPVAVKVLRPQFAQDTGVRIRFEREAQAVASFSHPHIVDVFDVGEEGDQPYLIMEYIEGETLKQVIEAEGPFEPDEVSALLEQVASALDYAHERGVVHRDIKPQNIIVNNDGLAKVLDFGIAKGLNDLSLTETGTGIGTVHYVSPEQAGGLMATPSSDIYALGVVAFEMLTRALPFDAESAVAIAVAHMHDQPPRPSELEPAITGAVDAIVLRALAKDPTQRYSSAGDLASAMAGWRSYRPDRSARTAVSASAAPIVDRYAGWPVGRPDPSAATVALPPPHTYNPALSQPIRGTGEISPQRAAGPGTSERQHPSIRPADILSGHGRREDIGASTWIIGSVVMIALVVLTVLGARFSDGLGRDETPEIDRGSIAGSQPERDDRLVDGRLIDQSDVPAESRSGSIANPIEPDLATTDGAADGIPDVLGMGIDDARIMLAEQGMVLQVTTDTVFSDNVPEGHIAQQDPPAGQSISAGEVIFAKLSRGSSTIDLTGLELVGMSVDEARTVLAERNVQVVEEAVASVPVPRDHVAAFTPDANVQVGDTVTLQVSQGDAARIPEDAFGAPRETVVEQLQTSGLVVADEEPVGREIIERAGVDLQTRGIDDDDVVGIQSDDGTATFGIWLPTGSDVVVVYYDDELNDPSMPSDDE